MTKIEDIERTIVRFLSGECSSQEEEFLLRWKNEKKENRKFFEQMRDAWMASAVRTENDKPLVTEEFARLKIRIASESATSEPKPVVEASAAPKTKSRLIYIPYAAALLALGLFFFWRQFATPKPAEPFVALGTDSAARVLFETKPGSIASITLPDGTRVNLNSQSSLSYSTDFDRTQRDVELSGEAFFDVAPDRGHPFVVNARELKVTAKGTSFNVSAYPGDRLVTTTLETGKVLIEGVSDEGSPFHIPMVPNQTVMILVGNREPVSEYLTMKELEAVERMKKSSVPIVRFTDVHTKIYTSWKDNRWIVDNETLGSLSDKLGRRYNVDIHFFDSVAARYNFTGTFESETIEEIMAILRHTLPIKYRMEKGNIEISTDSARQPSFR